MTIPVHLLKPQQREFFSIYDRIITGRERLNLGHIVSLTRIALHGPPPVTPESVNLSKAAMANHMGGENFQKPRVKGIR